MANQALQRTQKSRAAELGVMFLTQITEKESQND